MLRWFKDRSKVLAVVAPRSNTGTSILAANLAVVFAQLGERTLVIDANLRRPSQHLLFGIKGKLGLSGVLAGAVQLKKHHRSSIHLRICMSSALAPRCPIPRSYRTNGIFICDRDDTGSV